MPLSDELLLGFVKGHFHPSEHICIQSEGRKNMFHTNCLLFIVWVNANLRGSPASPFIRLNNTVALSKDLF